MEKKGSIVIKIGEKADFIRSVSQEKIMSELRIIATEKISESEGIVQPIRMMDGFVNDLSKKDTIILVWNVVETNGSSIGSSVDVYQTDEKENKGYFYTSKTLVNNLLFSVCCIEHVEEIAFLEGPENDVFSQIDLIIKEAIESGTIKPIETEADMLVADTLEFDVLENDTLENDTLENDTLENDTLTLEADTNLEKCSKIFTEDDVNSFKEKYELVLEDLKEQVKNLTEFVRKNYTIVPQFVYSDNEIMYDHEVMHEKEESKKPKNKRERANTGLEGVVHEVLKFDRKKLKPCTEIERTSTGLEGIAREVSKFDKKKLKSRAERDRLLARKRHHCELLYIADQDNQESYW